MIGQMDGNLYALEEYQREYDSYTMTTYICNKCGAEFDEYPEDCIDDGGSHIGCGGFISEYEEEDYED